MASESYSQPEVHVMDGAEEVGEASSRDRIIAIWMHFAGKNG